MPPFIRKWSVLTTPNFLVNNMDGSIREALSKALEDNKNYECTIYQMRDEIMRLYKVNDELRQCFSLPPVNFSSDIKELGPAILAFCWDMESAHWRAPLPYGSREHWKLTRKEMYRQLLKKFRAEFERTMPRNSPFKDHF